MNPALSYDPGGRQLTNAEYRSVPASGPNLTVDQPQSVNKPCHTTMPGILANRQILKRPLYPKTPSGVHFRLVKLSLHFLVEKDVGYAIATGNEHYMINKMDAVLFTPQQ
ncbi:hypothetical protein EVAR_100765_1 [Eumeta japonica]|uniref:Uncharacterized protein n=1 Tax=Eumeta variegata TaxID=151549 RepID=A0A4C1SV27_EUMVA|nr:hypothetical protein EVAR_100765_1 [Eumeta japonica]